MSQLYPAAPALSSEKTLMRAGPTKWDAGLKRLEEESEGRGGPHKGCGLVSKENAQRLEAEAIKPAAPVPIDEVGNRTLELQTAA